MEEDEKEAVVTPTRKTVLWVVSCSLACFEAHRWSSIKVQSRLMGNYLPASLWYHCGS